MKLPDRPALRMIAAHLLFWLIYVAAEYLTDLPHMQAGEHGRFFRSTFLSLPAMMAAAYFTALFIVPRYLQTNRWYWFLTWILVVAAFLFFARLKWMELVFWLEERRFFKIPYGKVLKSIIRDYAVVALAVCIYIIGDYRRKQKLNEELVKAKAEAEIKLLKGQLHPHFLFNSLNNIYSLALTKSGSTADSILKLTELLDYLVYRANMEKVPLSKEVELLENYVGLEQLRHGEKLKTTLDFSLYNETVQVAPLLLLPFAENCFKHGGVGKKGFFRVELYLHTSLKALNFKVLNTKSSRKPALQNHGGVGLENIRKRLSLLYPGRHELKIENGEEIYIAELTIHFTDEKI